MSKTSRAAMPALVPGQKLLFVSATRTQGPIREPFMSEAAVQSVARKWVYLNKALGRMHKDTWEIDGAGYNSPGRCYLSHEHYEAEMRANRLWAELNRKIRYWRPPGVTIEQIRSAAAVLGVELPPDEPAGDG